MAGKFDGVNDKQWAWFEKILPVRERKVGRGRPPTPMRYIINSLLYILMTGCRWCDLPRGKPWSSKSVAHRALQKWSKEGTLEEIKAKVLGLAENQGQIDWSGASVDGSFSPWEGGRSRC